MIDRKKKSNELAELLKKIQYKTGFTMEEISSRIQYSRSYLSKAIKNPAVQHNVIGRINEVFKEVLAEPGPGVVSTENDALVLVLLYRMAQLLSQQSGQSEVVEIESMKKDARALLKASLS